MANPDIIELSTYGRCSCSELLYQSHLCRNGLLVNEGSSTRFREDNAVTGLEVVLVEQACHYIYLNVSDIVYFLYKSD